MFLLATLAEAQKVDVDYNPSANFARMKTFAWDPDNPLPPSLPDLNANSVEAAVRSSVENYLRSRGFFQVMSNADFLVSYTFLGGADPEGAPAAPAAQAGAEDGWRPFQKESTEKIDAAIVLSVRDPANKEIVWQARALQVLVADKKLDSKIDKAVKKMLSKFPPK